MRSDWCWFNFNQSAPVKNWNELFSMNFFDESSRWMRNVANTNVWWLCFSVFDLLWRNMWCYLLMWRWFSLLTQCSNAMAAKIKIVNSLPSQRDALINPDCRMTSCYNFTDSLLISATISSEETWLGPFEQDLIAIVIYSCGKFQSKVSNCPIINKKLFWFYLWEHSGERWREITIALVAPVQHLITRSFWSQKALVDTLCLLNAIIREHVGLKGQWSRDCQQLNRSMKMLKWLQT